MKKLIAVALMWSSAVSLAAPPAGQSGKGDWEARMVERRAEREKTGRVMFVVGLAEALELSESDALKLSEKVRGFHDKRRPIHEAMGEAMRTLRAVAKGDAAAQTQVDGAIAKLLDGRQQLAALDKELFTTLGRDLSPQKRAQLALFLAKFHSRHHAMKGGHEGGREGRHRRGMMRH